MSPILLAHNPVSSSVAIVLAASPSTITLDLDVHKEIVTIAVRRGDAATSDQVDRLPSNLPKLTRYVESLWGSSEVSS